MAYDKELRLRNKLKWPVCSNEEVFGYLAGSTYERERIDSSSFLRRRAVEVYVGRTL